MSGADLFVVCKSCGSEVSAYITECPYCGNRLRKRAPKLDKPGEPPRPSRRARARGGRRRTQLGRLRRGEIPGIRLDSRPWATIVLVVASVGLSLAIRVGAVSLETVAVAPPLGDTWWRVLVAPFAYVSQGYLLVALVAIALFGWLLERRHGWGVPAVVFVVGGAGGMLASALLGLDRAPDPSWWPSGGNGAALALLAAWAVPDLRERRRGEETDSDLVGVAVIAAVLLLLPLPVRAASPIAGTTGGLLGLLLGYGLATISRAR